MVPLVLPALLVFSHLAPDAGRSTALVLVACLPLPHSPAALCLRPIIPLPDLIFVLFSKAPSWPQRGDLAPDPDLTSERGKIHPQRIRGGRQRCVLQLW